ncbi:MAG: hypothetical protein IPL43_16055 [Micropruina sp.]|nr:hypothetical protein [Micropruina sp.]
MLYIKPGGLPLATLAVADLVPLRIDVLRDALAGGEGVEATRFRRPRPPRIDDPGGRRPSVESVHALVPDSLV